MARPKPGNYAIYTEAGKKRYETALRKYLANKRKAEEARKITSTKKNIEKQKTANKNATTTTKTTKGTTTTKPKSTAAKGKSLATGKTTSKTKAVETPQTTTATKTRTRTRTQTKSKTTPKTTPKSKTPAKTTPKSKTPARTTNKQPTKQPAKRGRPVGSKNKPKGNQTLKIAGEGAKKTGKFLKNTAKQAYDLGKKGVNKVQTKLSAKDQTPQQSIPEGKSKGAKIAKSLNKRIGNYAKRVYNKAALDTFKFKTVMKDPSKRATNTAGIKSSIGSGAALLAGNALINRLTKPKGMTFKEWEKKKAEMEQASYDKRRKLVVKAGKGAVNLVKKGVNKIRGKSNTQTSTTQNINKQKKVNNNKVTNPNADKLKIAKKRVRNAKGYNKEKLQREVRYLEKFGKQGRTWSNPEGAKGNNKPSSVKTDTSTKSPKPSSARAKLRAKNEARFGKAHVDKLRAKNKDFQAMKKKKMTKAEFIRRYPNSITAQKAKGLRK